MIILCNSHSFTPHKSVTVWDIFMIFIGMFFKDRRSCLRINDCSSCFIFELWHFDYVFIIFFIFYILDHAKAHSEFSQDDVLGTGMSVHPF